MTRDRGMTLIELMVVIACIAILAAILFPVFARTREKARSTSCVNNQINIVLALHMYATDYGGRFPPVEDDLTPLVDRYCRSEQVFTCPSSAGGVPMGAPANPAVYQQAPSAEAPIEGGETPKEEAAEPPIETSYYYRAGLTATEWPAKPVLSDHGLEHNERANVTYSDGRCMPMSAPEWSAKGFAPLGPGQLPAGPGMMGGGP